MKLPNYVFNKPLYMLCNFSTGGHINLIHIPSKGKYALYNATGNDAIKQRLFNSVDKAEEHFYNAITLHTKTGGVISKMVKL